MRARTIIVAVAAMLVAAGSASADYWSVTDLGTLPGGSTSSAYSVNDNGQIVGSATVGNESHSCRFDSPNIDLRSLGFDESVVCWSVNNSCHIVGQAHLAPGFISRACLFDPTGGGANTNLGILPGYQQSTAYSINNHDQIVGDSENYGPQYYARNRACRFYTTGGPPKDLGTLSGYDYSTAYSINEHDQIVGASWTNPGFYDAHATRFDPTGDGANTDLGGLDGYNYSYAVSNNNSGQIVGYAFDVPGYHSRAVLFDATGGGANIALGTLVGYDSSSATSINDKADIVGNAWNSTGPAHAWLFDPWTGHMVDLNSLIDPSLGWTLTYASDINNNGWIVGYGINADGETHAYLLTPEPGTLTLLGVGGLALLRRRRG